MRNSGAKSDGWRVEMICTLQVWRRTFQKTGEMPLSSGYILKEFAFSFLYLV